MFTKSNILIVEDRKEHRKLMQNNFIHKGFKAYVAESGKIAVKKFQEYRINGILADMHMEPIDGVETIRMIREIDLNVPVIAITAYDMNNYKPRAGNLNIMEWFHKPITEKKLDRIGNLLNEAIIIKEKNRMKDELTSEIMEYIQNTLPETINFIKNNKEILELIRDVFAREVPEMQKCINYLLLSNFVATGKKYQNIQTKLSEMIERLEG